MTSRNSQKHYSDVMFELLEQLALDERLEQPDDCLAVLGLTAAIHTKMVYPYITQEQFTKVMGACYSDVQTIIARHHNLQEVIADLQLTMMNLMRDKDKK